MILLIILFVSSDCAKPALRIWSGRDAALNEFPYVLRMEAHGVANNAAIQLHVCTCAALTEVWSLTAGHCIRGLQETAHVLKSLMRHLSNDVSIDVIGVIRHPSKSALPSNHDGFSAIIQSFEHPTYSGAKSFTGNVLAARNDIGLLQHHPVPLKRYGKIAAIDYFTLLGQESFIVGYGIAKYNDSSMKLIDTLTSNKTLQAKKVMVTRCDNEFDQFHPLLCLSGRCGVGARHWSTVCQGDSGGPLVHPAGIIGLNSLGLDCGDPVKRAMSWNARFVGLVTPVSPFLHWITSVLKETVFDANAKPNVKYDPNRIKVLDLENMDLV